MASMTTTLATFFWIAFAFLVIKVVVGINSVATDAMFLVVTILSMLIVFASAMKERCGTTSIGSLFTIVLLPWLFMLGGIIVLIRVFPGWIQPFSNTFGYLVSSIPSLQSSQKLIDILSAQNSSLTKLISQDTSLLLNEFSTSRFDETIQKMKQEGFVTGSEEKIAEFKHVVVLKDNVAEFLWHLMVGCVAITTSYNFMMNTTCQKEEVTVLPNPTLDTL